MKIMKMEKQPPSKTRQQTQMDDSFLQDKPVFNLVIIILILCWMNDFFLWNLVCNTYSI